MSSSPIATAAAAATSPNGAKPALPNSDAAPARPGPSTLSVHGGEARAKAFHSITTPIVQASTYTFRDTAALVEYMEERMFWDEPQRDEYGRYGNPTVRAVEARLAALENGDDALLTPSGMSAITGTLLVFLSAGSHMVCTIDCYRRTRDFIQTILTRYGVEATVVPAADLQAIEDAIQPEHAADLLRVTHQPVHALPRPGGTGRHRPPAQRAHGHRQHLCYAAQPAPAGLRHRSGDP